MLRIACLFVSWSHELVFLCREFSLRKYFFLLWTCSEINWWKKKWDVGFVQTWETGTRTRVFVCVLITRTVKCKSLLQQGGFSLEPKFKFRIPCNTNTDRTIKENVHNLAQLQSSGHKIDSLNICSKYTVDEKKNKRKKQTKTDKTKKSKTNKTRKKPAKKKPSEKDWKKTRTFFIIVSKFNEISEV